jgi:hypothetical protein
MRLALSKRIEAGKIQVSARRTFDDGSVSESEERDLEIVPPLDLMCDLSHISAIVTDDRCLNKLPTWTDSFGTSAVAASTLNLMETLRGRQLIDNATFWRARHRLRAAGYIAVPLEPDELKHYLDAAPVVDKAVRETPELRAIRESLSIGRINEAFLAAEEPWLAGIRLCIYKVLREIWVDSSDIELAEARGDWLLLIFPDPLAWCLHPENDSMWAAARQQLAVQTGLLMLFIDGTPQRRQRYAAWLDERVAKRIRQVHPEIWDSTVEFLKSYIQKLTRIEGGT